MPKTNESYEANSLEKVVPKLGRKLSDSLSKTAKGKIVNQKKTEGKAKRSLSKEPEEVVIKQEPIDNSYDTTIDEVIASSMLIEDSLSNEEEGEEEFEVETRKLVRNPFIEKSAAVNKKRGLRSNGKLKQAASKGETGEFFEAIFVEHFFFLNLCTTSQQIIDVLGQQSQHFIYFNFLFAFDLF